MNDQFDVGSTDGQAAQDRQWAQRPDAPQPQPADAAPVPTPAPPQWGQQAWGGQVPPQGPQSQPVQPFPGQPFPGQPFPGQQQFPPAPYPGQQFPPAGFPGGQYPQPGPFPTGQVPQPQYSPPQYAAPQYADAQFPQQPYPGQPLPGQYFPPGQYPGQPPYPTAPPEHGPAKSTVSKWVGIGIVALLLAGGVVAAVLGTRGTTLDRAAAEQGVAQVLADSYGATDVADVACPSGQKVVKDATFTCTLTVKGNPQQVTVTFTDDEGTYEVGRPTTP
ncbi:DUF4333 domain-containing protein [Rhodococcus tukisamuensis]|uniref:DUF4333 domain-containing protein n=1 Tax=Rhodococcus tukisamuensis TaxID=168276 RepID=A0A1G6UCA8_9NOCA|nr:DUF4333 domain-containing protein [Rhodococcus tukisamuensis]SDD38215.1 protein of unknown function [Rhodococcus tukisamuensis]